MPLVEPMRQVDSRRRLEALSKLDPRLLSHLRSLQC